MLIDFYGENIFRVLQDNSGKMIRDPETKPEAQILINNPRRAVSKLYLSDENGFISITTGKSNVQLDKKTSLLKVINLKTKITRKNQIYLVRVPQYIPHPQLYCSANRASAFKYLVPYFK